MKNYYLLKISYIGHQYFGIQKQTQFKTIQGEVEIAINRAAQDSLIKSFPASRTDSKVSALENFIFLSTNKEVNFDDFKKALPSSIQLISHRRVDRSFKFFNFIRSKTYHYYFEKESSSAFVYSSEKELDISKMRSAANLFVGEHDFKNYQYRGSTQNTRRSITCCSIEQVDQQIFGKRIESLALIIKGEGFLKQMVRIIMGTLIQVGLGEVSEDQIKESLRDDSHLKLGFIAPGEALVLTEVVHSESSTAGNI